MKNICIISHGGRMKCLLKKMGMSTDDKHGMPIKFKNCATILLNITKNNINVSMCHDGKLTKPKNGCKYFVNNVVDPHDIQFKNVNYKNEKYNKMLNILNIKNSDINCDLNIYIVRHGEVYHNTLSLYDKIIQFHDIKDPNITKTGKKQSQEIGNKLNHIAFDYFFVSDLKRTKETLKNMFKNINDNIFVLPCSHELQYVNNGNSDGHQLITSLTNENKTTHKYNDKNNDFLIWDYYYDFYEGVRGENIIFKKCKCRETNMISLSLFIMKSIENNENYNVLDWINKRSSQKIDYKITK
jgi:broad specificity phosphatase PhoE